MKKYFVIVLSAICMLCLAGAVACKSDDHTHTWVATEETDSDGNYVYVCSDCGETHTHTFASGYTYSSAGHWHAATCGHDEATSGYSEHVYEDGDTVCTICGYDSSADAEYNIEFSYYQYDEDGEIVYDSTESYYIEVGVTYTAVESSSGFTVDIENGDSVVAGDVVSFTVAKSVYCYYTDSNTYPVVNVNDEVIAPDSNGVYTFTVESDMATSDGNLIVWVSNVETRPSTIGGSGTEDDPYTINTVTDWLYFASYINNKTYYGVGWNVAYWTLEDDLDFEGEEAYVIGNAYSSTYATFMGNFNGKNHTLSNFVLTNAVSESEGTYSNYLGLFGVASAYSGISAVIQNLNVENFEIVGTAPSDGACIVGSIVGYAMGFNLVNCTATNGTITVNGNTSNYSYGGGLIGILQSYLDEDNEIAYYSCMQYNSVSNVEITGSGVVYAAGGLVAYVTPYAESAPVYITNNYASDVTISGAIRSGGIAGTIGRYTSVQNCYAVGTITSISTLTTVYDDFEGTQLDDTISYAGGIAGFAENDTIISACFFVGTVTASASGGTKYTGYICGGYAAAGYESYYSEALMLLNNLHNNTTKITSSAVTQTALENIGWNTADWTFSGTYPTINSTTQSYSYKITINIDGAAYDTVTVDSTVTSSVYVPMSYRYLLEDGGYSGGVPIYVRKANADGENNLRTYGYYFDSACTQRIPTSYVITGNITIYAKTADCTDIIEKEYYITGNGSVATIILHANGIYEYEEGAVYVTGSYEYNGDYLTFKDSYFSRLSSLASENQIASYYTFYATVNADGNLYIFDCDSTYTETPTTTYDYLARFFTEGSPLVAVDADNVTFAGKYYNATDYFEFDVDYTGAYTYNNASGTLTYSYNSEGGLEIKIGSRTFVATLDSQGIITTLTRYSGTTVAEQISLTPYDDFAGTWVQSGIIDAIYTFDGMGNWTYSYQTLSGKTYTTTTSSGTYTVSDENVLTFELSAGVTVTVTLNEDGTVNIEQSTGTEAVTYYNEHSLAGVWYTYGYKITRYTLTLEGLNSDGWGNAVYQGTEGFRYSVYSADEDAIILDIYYGDTLYAYVDYAAATGIMTGYFYNSSTEAYDTVHTFYIYDDFYGTWVGSSEDFATVTFNGFGLYNVARTSDTRAVRGTLSITTSAGVTTSNLYYTVDLKTGIATVVDSEDSVLYTFVYDAFTNTISLTAASGSYTLSEQDEYADVVFYTAAGTTYTFDGRGNLGSGIITITTSSGSTSGTYYITEEGKIAVTAGTSSYTIYCGDSGYVIGDGTNETDLYIENSFTGTWAINGWYNTLVIGSVRYIYEGENIQIAGTYGTTAVTLYYNGDQMWFTVNNTTYYITAIANGLVISTTQTYSEDDSYAYLAAKDALYGTWTASDGSTLKFDGTSGSALVLSNAEVTLTTADNTTYTGVYYYSNGTYVVVVNGTTYTYTLESSAATYAYTNGTYYLVTKTA